MGDLCGLILCAIVGLFRSWGPDGARYRQHREAWRVVPESFSCPHPIAWTVRQMLIRCLDFDQTEGP